MSDKNSREFDTVYATSVAGFETLFKAATTEALQFPEKNIRQIAERFFPVFWEAKQSAGEAYNALSKKPLDCPSDTKFIQDCIQVASRHIASDRATSKGVLNTEKAAQWKEYLKQLVASFNIERLPSERETQRFLQRIKARQTPYDGKGGIN